MSTIKFTRTTGGIKMVIDGGTPFYIIGDREITTSLSTDGNYVTLRWDGFDHPFAISNSFDVAGTVVTGSQATIKSTIDSFLNSSSAGSGVSKDLSFEALSYASTQNIAFNALRPNKKLTLGGNITVNVTGTNDGDCGNVQITRGTSGTETLAFSGTVLGSPNYNTGAGAVVLMSYVNISGSVFWICNNPESIQTKLATPTLTATVINATEIDISWTTNLNATNYVLKRNTSNTLAGATQIYSGSGSSYNNTGLTVSTLYYYFLTAQGTGYADSNPATANGTTPSEALVWNVDKTAGLTYDANGTLFNNNTANSGASASKQLGSTGSFVQYEVPPTPADSYTAVLGIANTLLGGTSYSSSNIAIPGIYINTGNAYRPDTNALLTTVVAGDKLRLQVSGNDLLYYKSTGGGAFTLFYTYSGAFTSFTNKYIRGVFAFTVGANIKLLNVQGGGLV